MLNRIDRISRVSGRMFVRVSEVKRGELTELGENINRMTRDLVALALSKCDQSHYINSWIYTLNYIISYFELTVLEYEIG